MKLRCNLDGSHMQFSYCLDGANRSVTDQSYIGKFLLLRSGGGGVEKSSLKLSQLPTNLRFKLKLSLAK